MAHKNTKKQKEKNPYVQIMMLGGRRVGKTSLLASMYEAFGKITGGTNLVMSRTGGVALDQSLDSMQVFFSKDHMVDEVVEILDKGGTRGFDNIDFTLTIAGKKEIGRKIIRFVDCSGESISQRREDIGELIEKSEVVIIAIDSVFLMEENGRYHNEYNAVRPVTDFIKSSMNPDALFNSKKMVLFVPLKCEKYYHRHMRSGSVFSGKAMQDLVEKVEETYADLLNFLTSPNNKKYFTVGIFPALTLGGIEFDTFTKELNSENVLTEDILYRYCEPDRYEPQFCDRPLIYSLLFVQKKINDNYYAKAYDANKNKKKLWATIVEWIQDRRNMPKDVDFVQEIEKIIDNLNRENCPGFKLIQDPDFLEVKAKL